STPEPKYVENETLDQTRKRCKWDNDDYICQEYILNGMSDALFDVYQNVESAKELRDQLEAKYMAEDTSSKKFLVSNFNNDKMVDSNIIEKLPPSWKDFKHMLKHNKDELSLVQLGSHFRIEETLRMEESGKGKGKEIVGSSSVNMVEDYKNKNNNKNSKGNKRKFHDKKNDSNRKSKIACWKCGKTGHFKKDCRVKKNNGAVVRLPESKKKILGENGIDCIFIGYDEHSKAYRFYVIEPNDFISINLVIESRDAIFDENIFSSIPRPKDIISSSNGTQGGDLSGETPIEIPEPRRSNRARVAKSYGSNFQLYLVEGSRDEIASQYSYCYNIEEDPKTFDEAMKSRDANVILEIRIKHENKGLTITQSHYIDKILKKFKCEVCGPVSTPIEAGIKLMPHMGKPVNQLEYSWAIEWLMYAMTSTRPNISYAVEKLSRFTSNPSNHHWEAIIRVFRYLKKTMNYGLSYVGFPSVLKGYSYASWITNSKDHTSTTGWVFLLGGGAISWASKKQTCITDSTMESEFVALAAARKEAEWLRNLIYEILLWPKPISSISMDCDSAATLAKAYRQIYNGKSRHLGIRNNMVRELITNGVISMDFVRS
nr:zinc finger, CCHC-type [Tanacetum cinerariifolium]